jgi:intracellular multiplication protein IcmE
MLKKGMSILSRYPRLRVLFFGVGAVTIVGVSMHVFTKKQDLGKTPQGPLSHVDTQKIPLKDKRMVGSGKHYSKLINKYDRDKYNNRLKRADTIMDGSWFDDGKGQKDAKNAKAHSTDKNNSNNQKDHAANVAPKHKVTAPAEKNNSSEQKPMMSPSEFAKAAHEAETLPRGASATRNTAAAQRSMMSPSQFENAQRQNRRAMPGNFNRNVAAAQMPLPRSMSHDFNNQRPQFNPKSYHPEYRESPQQIQRHQQQVSALASKMQGQLSSMGANLNMPVASQVTVKQDSDNNAENAKTAAQSAADNLANPAQIIKAATVYFAIIQNKVSSDQPSTPVMAKLITGPYKGAKLLGGFYTEKDKLLMKFNTMVLKSRAKSFSIGKSYAIDTKDGQMAVETDVNHHYVLRYGSLFAAAFLQGLGDAYTPSNSYMQCNPLIPGSCDTGSSDYNNNPNNVNTKVALMRGAGQVGKSLGQHIGSYFNTPNTVTVAQGTLVGILFMNDVTVPRVQVVQTDPDYSEPAGTNLDFLSDDS